jgi:hypothetical protein
MFNAFLASVCIIDSGCMLTWQLKAIRVRSQLE